MFIIRSFSQYTQQWYMSYNFADSLRAGSCSQAVSKALLGFSKTKKDTLCLWLRASLIYINNCPTRYNTKQSIYYSASTLNMFRVSTTPIIRSTQNCNYSLQYWLYFLCRYLLPPTWSSLATLEGSSCTVSEAVVAVLCTPDDGCGSHAKHVE